MARKSRKTDSLVSVTDQQPLSVLNQSFGAWIYTRISDDGEKTADSIDNQLALCKQFIHSQPALTVAGHFTDLGYSGTTFNRPGYSDMMTGILAGDITCVVVKDVSRLGRSYIEVGELLFDTFVRYGVRFISVNDNYDSFADDAGRKKLLILFKNLVNHLYSRDISKKIKSAADAKKRRGEPLGLAPYGYTIDSKEKKFKIVPDAAEVVQLIFTMREQGHSTASISKHLNRENIPTAQKRRYELGEINSPQFAGKLVWSGRHVSYILHNEMYIGSLIQGKYQDNSKKKRPKEEWIVHENAHEAIISQSQFNTVAQLMTVTTQKYKQRGEVKREENRYIRKMVCQRCGKAASRTNSSSATQTAAHYYYGCTPCGIELKEELGITRATKLSQTKLDTIIMATLQVHFDALVQYDDLEKDLVKHEPLQKVRSDLNKQLQKVQTTLATHENTLATAYTHHLSGLLDLREYGLIRDKTEQEKRRAETQLAKLKIKSSSAATSNILNNQWLIQYRAFRTCKTPTKEMVQTLVHRVLLTPMTNELHIELNFMADFIDLHQIINLGMEVAN